MQQCIIRIKCYNIIHKQSEQSTSPHIEKKCCSVKRIPIVTEALTPTECLLGVGIMCNEWKVHAKHVK